MQATLSCSAKPCLARSAATKAPRAAARVVVCRAQQQNVVKAAAVSLPALLAAHPALALVDDRLAGEGTGKIFGINDPALFWTIAIMFSLVWSVYYISQRDLGGDKGDDSGLTL